MTLSSKEILSQSEGALAQWREIWENNAFTNGEIYKAEGTSHQDLLFEGVGKKLICVAAGPSLEKLISIIRDYKNESVEIACVDKCLGMLIDNGIIPDYVFIADAGIDYNKWCKPYIDHTKDIKLICNVTAQIDWVKNWQGKRYFYVNKDNIHSEEIFMPISGCTEVIPASSNVGNSVVVFASQILGYDEIYLVGYDYGWSDSDNYYAYNDSIKRCWMKHITLIDKKGQLFNTSQNLFFSARWLIDFHKSISSQKNIKIYDCSEQGIAGLPDADLKRKLKISKKREVTQKEKDNIYKARMRRIVIDRAQGEQELESVLKTVNVSQVIVNHIPDQALKFLEAL